MDIDSLSKESLNGKSSQQSKTTNVPVRSDSKWAKVRRRVGTESQLTPLEDLDAAQAEAEEPPHKKFKSFDPDVESVASQALERRKAMQQAAEQSQTKTAAADKARAKRKVTEALPEDDEENEDAARPSTSRNRSTQPESTTARRSKRQKEDADSATEKQPAGSQYLQINTGRRKVNPVDASFNKEFNELKIARPRTIVSHKMGWNERDVIQEELEEEDDSEWRPDDKSTFLQVKFVNFPPHERPCQPLPPHDPRNTGRPNFKAFKPKSVKGASQQRAQRPAIVLVAHEPLGYGLKESYGSDADLKVKKGGDDNDDDGDDIQMPLLPSQRKRKTVSKTTKPTKLAVVSESSGEDEQDEDRVQQRRHGSEEEPEQLPKSGRGRAKETITIDSDSEEDGVRTFGGRVMGRPGACLSFFGRTLTKPLSLSLSLGNDAQASHVRRPKEGVLGVASGFTGSRQVQAALCSRRKGTKGFPW